MHLNSPFFMFLTDNQTDWSWTNFVTRVITVWWKILKNEANRQWWRNNCYPALANIWNEKLDTILNELYKGYTNFIMIIKCFNLKTNFSPRNWINLIFTFSILKNHIMVKSLKLKPNHEYFCPWPDSSIFSHLINYIH